jgi:hypothetical protein
MKYAPYVHHKGTKAGALAAALGGNAHDRTVYVIGWQEDHELLAAALAGRDPTEAIAEFAEDVGDIVKLAHALKYVEAIGTPDGRVTEAQLVEMAKQRIKILEVKNGRN